MVFTLLSIYCYLCILKKFHKHHDCENQEGYAADFQCSIHKTKPPLCKSNCKGVVLKRKRNQSIGNHHIIKLAPTTALAGIAGIYPSRITV